MWSKVRKGQLRAFQQFSGWPLMLFVIFWSLIDFSRSFSDVNSSYDHNCQWVDPCATFVCEVIGGQLGENEKKKFWYVIKLCEMFTLARLPLQSDARFSSYSGQKVNFYTFMAIILGVYLGATWNFRTSGKQGRRIFYNKRVMWSKVRKGQLGPLNVSF